MSLISSSSSQQPIPPGGTPQPAASQSASLSGDNTPTVSASSTQTNIPIPAPQSAPMPPLTQSPGLGAPPMAQQNLNDAAGRRVRLRPKPNAMSQVLGSTGLMQPLKDTGLIFPYQPTITYSQDVSYTSMEIVHANQDFYSYSKTPALKLTVEGDFTVQNQTEGLYSLACIHFLRTVSKMDFGSGPNPGQPPPVLLFDAYGQWMFNALPVIVTQFSVTLPKDVDYVGISANSSTINTQPPATIVQSSLFGTINNSQLNGYNPSVAGNNSTSASSQGYAWLPALFSISVQLTVQNTPQRLRAFNLNQFRTGALLSQGTWV